MLSTSDIITDHSFLTQSQKEPWLEPSSIISYFSW